MADCNVTKCPCCNEDGKITCTVCENVKYCSMECQQADLAAHHHLCNTFKDFQEPPQCDDKHAFHSVFDDEQPDMVRAIYFPVDEQKPKWVWLPATLCNAESEDELKSYLGKEPGEKLKLNKAFNVVIDCVARKKFKHRVDVLIDHAYNFDGSPINQSVLHFTSGRVAFGWSAPIVAYAARGEWNREDMDMEDATALCNFMVDYWNDRPEFVAGKRCKGRKVEGVKIRCDGEVEKTGGEKYVAVKVPPSASVFYLGKSVVHASQIAADLGLPLITKAYEAIPGAAGTRPTGYVNNFPAALMHKTIDPKAPAADLFFNVPGHFGVPLKRWLDGAGDVLVVRKDRRPIKPYVVEALVSFIEHELCPLFQCLREGAHHEGRPVTRQQLLGQITPKKWEAYLEEWKEEKGIQDEDSDEEDDDSDDDSFNASII